MLPDHADLAAPEQAQREWARARRGERLIRRSRTAAPVDWGTFLAAHTERLFRLPARILVSSADLSLLPLRQRDWLRPGRRT